MAVRVKDPAEIIDFSFDWDDDWLVTNETIDTSSWAITPQSGASPEDDLEINGTPTKTTTTTTAFVRGGVAGRTYHLKNTITTSEGRTGERTVVIRVAQL